MDDRKAFPSQVLPPIMLSEHFIATTGTPAKAPGTSVVKDAAIFVYETQPTATQRAIFKKSATPPNCLAVSSTHIFAAQVEKASVHVYNREKGNLEATVPFTERITGLALACEDAVLVLGTKEGRVFLWEVATGRQVSTAQAHLQAVTALSVDARSNFLVSASADSTCHVWSLPSLLSFVNAGAQPLAPLHTFSAHRAPVQAMAIGHSEGFQNIVVTAAQDKTCLVWDYQSNAVVRTFLLAATPSSLVLDAADRVFYVGYEDGSIQRMDLIAADGDSLLSTTNALVPVQVKSAKWSSPDAAIGSALALTLSFDGTGLLSGHQSGDILSWDVASASGHMKTMLPQGSLPGPVTNLSFLSVVGFAGDITRSFKLDSVVKPKFGAFQDSEAGHAAVPGSYALHAQLNNATSSGQMTTESSFKQALFSSSFHADLLEEGLSELSSWGQTGGGHATNGASLEPADDFMALDEPATASEQSNLQDENAELKTQLQALRRVQLASFDKLEKLQAERQALLLRERNRMAKPETNGTTLGAQSNSSSNGDDGEVMGSENDSDSD